MSANFWVIRKVLLATLLVWVFVFNLPAQTSKAHITGIVRDQSGAAIPSVDIIATAVATGVRRETASNESGIYTIPLLEPGAYKVEVRKSGFRVVEQSGIRLEVNQAARLDFTLEVGAVSERLEVTAAAPLVDRESAAMGTVLGNQQILDLPLNARNAFRLTLLAPGVTPSQTHGDFYNSAGAFSVNGGRPNMNEVLIDGVTNALPEANQFNLVALQPSPDALQEFKVQTNGYPAEFGRTAGGVVNMVLRSGTNRFHGTLFEFLRNSKMDANNFFSNRTGTPLATFQRNQFGLTFGGPIVRDKAFFFVNYEGLRQRSQSLRSSKVPTALERAGDFSRSFEIVGGNCVPVQVFDPVSTRRNAAGTGYVRDQFSGNVIPASRFDPVGAKLITYYPLPNQPGEGCAELNNFFSSRSAKLNTDQMDIKLDWAANAKDRFSAGLSWRERELFNPNHFGTIGEPSDGVLGDFNPVKGLRLDYTRVHTPNVVLNARFGIGRLERTIPPPTPEGFQVTEIGFPRVLQEQMRQPTTFPGVGVTGHSPLGFSGYSFVFWSTTVYNGNASATWIRGRHAVKFGMDARVNQVFEDTGFASHGNFNFSRAYTQGPDPNAPRADRGHGIASLLLGTGGGFIQFLPGILTSNNYYAFYAQDDFKLTSRLTLNVGLRYDLENGRTERFKQLSYFDFDAPSPLAQQTGLAGLKGGLRFLDDKVRRQFDTDQNNFGPRFGLSYSVTPRTVVRTGYGILYHPYTGAATGGAAGMSGFSTNTEWVDSLDGLTPASYLSNAFNGGLSLPTGRNAGLLANVGQALSGARSGVIDRGTRVGYTQQWNFNIQRELPGQTAAEVAYIGAKGTKLLDAGWDLNQLRPEHQALGLALQDLIPNPFFGILSSGPLAQPRVARSQLLRPYPHFLNMIYFRNAAASSIYHGFQARVRKQFADGSSFLAAYTTGKTIDDSAAPGVQSPNPGRMDAYNRGLDRSVAGFDVAQRLVLSYVYTLPLGKNRLVGGNWPAWLQFSLGNWQVNGITTLSTGMPVIGPSAPNNTFSQGGGQRANQSASAKLPGGRPTSEKIQKWFDTSVFSQPAQFTFGNAPRTLPDVRTDGIRNFDFSLFKEAPLGESRRIEFRAEAFNVFNTPQFGNPGTGFGNAGFGVVSSQLNTPRQIQLGMKFVF